MLRICIDVGKRFHVAWIFSFFERAAVKKNPHFTVYALVLDAVIIYMSYNGSQQEH